LDCIARARLTSGVVLLVYVATHLLNHALGLISLGAMEWGRNYFLAVWHKPGEALVLYGALRSIFPLSRAANSLFTAVTTRWTCS
jgi:adenylate cyclase